MKQDKDLQLKYLCMALPYGVVIEYNNDGFAETREMGLGSLHDFMFDNAEIKPYLRPMSSMTEEEKKELEDEINKDFKLAIIACKENDITKSTSGFYKIDWLNKHHFDYRCLIKKGLALEAPEGMYK